MTGSLNSLSPIPKAIRLVELQSTGEIRVHLSNKRKEKDLFGSATEIFKQFKMHQTQDRNAVLIYLNTRLRKLAILADTGLSDKVTPTYWGELADLLRDDLNSTYYENALLLTIQTIGETLKKLFPSS